MVVYLLVNHKREREALVTDIKNSHAETVSAHAAAKEDLKMVIIEANASRREDAVAKTKLADAVDGMRRTITRLPGSN